MDNHVAFVASALLILMTPGPTNTLLAIGGASQGFLLSLVLIPAEIAGYAISILCIKAILGPLVQYSFAMITLRILAGVFLLVIARRLWTTSLDKAVTKNTITFQDVFVATILNPKGIIFTLVVIPQDPDLWTKYFLALMPIIAAASVSWVGISSVMQPHLNLPAVRRTGAAVISAFAAVLMIAPFM